MNVTKNNRKEVLYLSYTGLLEPLGESQVYNYLKLLSDSHNISLITFEKKEYITDRDRFEEMQQVVANNDIDWYPLRYHRDPSFLATVWDLTNGLSKCMNLIRAKDIDIIHSRSYVPSVLALLCKKLFGVKFIFDMRGFWADERVDGNIWKSDSYLYRMAKWFESKFLTQSDVTISLTEAGIKEIRSFDHVDASNTCFEVIPTCVDLEQFTPSHSQMDESQFVLGYVGSVGTWHLFDDVLDCFELLTEIRSNAKFLVLNQNSKEYIHRKLEKRNIETDCVTVKSVEYPNVSAEMNRMDAGIFFYTPSFSKKGTSPTKMGEFLACGLPCLSNSHVGDVQKILEDNNVGVAIEEFSKKEKHAAMNKLVDLATTEETADRCRQVAESYYSLENGVSMLDDIYNNL